MQLKSYRAYTIQEAIELIRRDLGPDAAVLYTREVRRGWLGRIWRRRQIEVTASRDAHVPSLFALKASGRRKPAE
jgi:flagellar biosynthesis protein FlhF